MPAYKIQQRTDTAANWTSSNPTLSAGEIGVESDTFRRKTGDGSTAWTSLRYDHSSLALNSQSAAYEFVLADAGRTVLHPSADTTARTFTIPANGSVAFPVGSVLTVVNQNAAGVITLAITSDTMRLAGAGTTGSRSLAANGIATAIKVAATEWIISGTGLT